MSTSIFIKLKDGRIFPIGSDHAKDEAERIRVELEQWLISGTTLTLTNAKGQLVEVTPRGVLAIDLIDAGGGPKNASGGRPADRTP